MQRKVLKLTLIWLGLFLQIQIPCNVKWNICWQGVYVSTWMGVSKQSKKSPKSCCLLAGSISFDKTSSISLTMRSTPNPSKVGMQTANVCAGGRRMSVCTGLDVYLYNASVYLHVNNRIGMSEHSDSLLPRNFRVVRLIKSFPASLLTDCEIQSWTWLASWIESEKISLIFFSLRYRVLIFFATEM